MTSSIIGIERLNNLIPQDCNLFSNYWCNPFFSFLGIIYSFICIFVVIYAFWNYKDKKSTLEK